MHTVRSHRRKLLEQLLQRQDVAAEELISIIPELKDLADCTQNHPAHCWNVLEHTMKVVSGVPNILVLKIAALLHDIGKPISKTITEDGVEHFWGHQTKGAGIAKEILTELGYESLEVNKICTLIELHDTKIEPTRKGIEAILDIINMEELELLLLHQEADLLAHSQGYIARKLSGLITLKETFEIVKGEKTRKA